MPYHENNSKKQYLLDNADEVKYISGQYNRRYVHKRNRTMVGDSELCVAYLKKNEGGTFYTVKYALTRKLHV